jgi:RNA polymerase sigma factor (sigma-70 family)
MAKIKNKYLDDFFSELRFTPKRQKLIQLLATIELIEIIAPEKDYPLEFICFKITDYRPKTDYSGIVIGGGELIEDLRVMIAALSSQVELASTDYGQKVYSSAELAKKYSVSTKTIQRWRNQGLGGWMFLFPDGQKRIGIPQSCLDKFIQANPQVAERKGKFTKVSQTEKQTILDLAAKYAASGDLSRHQIYRRIAEHTGRALETIRYTIIGYEEKNPDVKLFNKPAGAIHPKEAAVIYKLYQQGTRAKELMARFHRSRSSIYRIINVRRARRLGQMKIEYIDSAEFLEENSAREILIESEAMSSLKRDKAGYLLNRIQEGELFRRYNYLKYLASVERTKINLKNPSGKTLEKIESYLEQSEKIKNIIIEANLRLVVSIAGKHKNSGQNLGDLVSEGNLSLIGAVEKFDYTRGFRFSTYATWAIAKSFARSIPHEAARPDQPDDTDMSKIDQDMRNINMVDLSAVENAHRSLEQIISDNLTERQQYIIRSHFGLEGDRITKKKKTLREIGDTLGLTRERVRQIELIALQQLRHCLSPEEFELLTG